MSLSRLLSDASSSVFLAIETGASVAGLAMLHRGAVTDFQTKYRGNARSEEILVDLKRGLEANKVALSQVRGIVVSEGPGSLTGLRIGQSIAKGLSDSLKVRLWSMPAFEAMRLVAPARAGNSILLLFSGDRFHLSSGSSTPLAENVVPLAGFDKWLAARGRNTEIILNQSDFDLIVSKFPDAVSDWGGKFNGFSESLGSLMLKRFAANLGASDNDGIDDWEGINTDDSQSAAD